MFFLCNLQTIKCARCKVVWYCSKVCQAAHWKGGHSKECVPSAGKTKPNPLEEKGKSKVTDDIPFITAKGKNTNNLELPEVQAAMADQMQSLMQNKDQWMTPELIEKMATNPVLRKAFTDPNYQRALQEFQTNPNAAAKKYAGVKEMEDFFHQVG
jgi:hypothetical protein